MALGALWLPSFLFGEKMMKKNMKRFVLIWGSVTPICLLFVLYFTFVTAYFSPGKAVTVYVDYFHEGLVELVLLTFCIPLSIFSVCHSLKMIHHAYPRTLRMQPLQVTETTFGAPQPGVLK
jgi:hypothetical protein